MISLPLTLGCLWSVMRVSGAEMRHFHSICPFIRMPSQTIEFHVDTITLLMLELCEYKCNLVQLLVCRSTRDAQTTVQEYQESGCTVRDQGAVISRDHSSDPLAQLTQLNLPLALSTALKCSWNCPSHSVRRNAEPMGDLSYGAGERNGAHRLLNSYHHHLRNSVEYSINRNGSYKGG